jgi:pimeloyl-ACP methyl ester carboxylesterase
LNGAVGDALAASGSGLAVSMGLHARGTPLSFSPASAAALRPRVCVFIHGLACDEHSWALRTDVWNSSSWADTLGAGTTIQYGELLEHELGFSAIHLRYNTGLAIDNNAQQFAELLDRAGRAAPHVVDWMLIGHSMGGLVARRAHAWAAEQGMHWAACTSTIVCLGSPHQGAPLEKLGDAAVRALSLSETTRPLARLADKRSRGIKDLRRGLAGKTGRASVAPTTPALRLVFATLGDEASTVVGNIIGKMFGDGLVTVASASDAGSGGDVERVEVAGLGHMGLLNHPRVYAVLRRWLGASEVD